MTSIIGPLLGGVEGLLSPVESGIEQLVGELLGPVGAAVTAAEAAIIRDAAAGGAVVGAPSADMAGVYAAWEVHRGYWNQGAARHHAELVAIAAQLGRM